MERYFEKAGQSRHIRDEQYSQMISYLTGILEKTEEKRAEYFKPDCSSVEAYEKSIEKYRKDYFDMLGYPPPHGEVPLKAREVLVGEDDVCTISRLFITVAEGLECYGIYMLPKERNGKLPLILSMHGALGCPEMICNFDKPYNYNDASRRLAEEGFAVFSPLYIFKAVADRDNTDIPEYAREILDTKARSINTTLVGIEMFKIIRAIDYLVTRDEIDENDIGTSGLSFGGQHSLILAAMDTRIRYCISSCGIVGYDTRARDFTRIDWRPVEKFSLAEIIGMICPRLCIIESGKYDDVLPVEEARKVVAQASVFYDRLGMGDNLRHSEFYAAHTYYLAHSLEYLKAVRNKK